MILLERVRLVVVVARSVVCSLLQLSILRSEPLYIEVYGTISNSISKPIFHDVGDVPNDIGNVLRDASAQRRRADVQRSHVLEEVRLVILCQFDRRNTSLGRSLDDLIVHISHSHHMNDTVAKVRLQNSLDDIEAHIVASMTQMRMIIYSRTTAIPRQRVIRKRRDKRLQST